MSEFHVEDEGIRAIIDGLRRNLDEIAAPHRLDQGFLEFVAKEFLSESIAGSRHIVECVTIPTDRAGISRIGVRLSWAFHLYAARAAKNYVSAVSH